MAKKKRKRNNTPRSMQRAQQQAHQQQIQQSVSVEEVTWSGPLPDAETLERYEKLVEGAADRIISMAEHQASHRQAMEKHALETGTKRAGQGLWLGFILVLVGMIAATILIWNGRETEGFVLILIQLGALASSFVFSNSRRR